MKWMNSFFQSLPVPRYYLKSSAGSIIVWNVSHIFTISVFPLSRCYFSDLTSERWRDQVVPGQGWHKSTFADGHWSPSGGGSGGSGGVWAGGFYSNQNTMLCYTACLPACLLPSSGESWENFHQPFLSSWLGCDCQLGVLLGNKEPETG